MKGSEKKLPGFIAAVTLVLLGLAAYFSALGFNDIWTPNEGFYADAAREMLASRNYLEIFYNNVPRFNKPPVMYWLIALSGHWFGLDEFAVRLPSAVAGVGTIMLVYAIGKLLESRELGAWAAIVMTFSFQFAINARYGTPEIVLTFFFTLSVYLFLLAFHQKKVWLLFFAYVVLGLTILTKGYPYLIIIGAILLAYWIADAKTGDGNWRSRLVFFRLHWGIPLALMIGMSWVVYMGWHFGGEFWEIFLNETYHRAFTRKGSFKPLFYLEINTWGFLPYSLIFFFALFWMVVNRLQAFRNAPVVRIGLLWFLVMLLVFTMAKGKIPTYFIQAHPAMSLLCAYFIIHFRPVPKSWQSIALQTAYFLPGLLFLGFGIFMVWKFESGILLWLFSAFPVLLLILGFRYRITWIGPAGFPFVAFGSAYLIFLFTVMPFIEQFRPHSELGQVVRAKAADPAIPVMVEGFHLQSLPFYAGRKIMEYSTMEHIREQQQRGPLLLLIRESRAGELEPGEVLWRGYLYEHSESRTLEFLLDCLRFDQGKPAHFLPFVLVAYPEKG